MANLDLVLAAEVSKWCGFDFCSMTNGARTFHVARGDYDLTFTDKYVIVQILSLRGLTLRIPRDLRLGELAELNKKNLCGPRSKEPAVTLLGDSSTRWVPFNGGVVRIVGCSMTVFRTEKPYNH